MDVEDTHDIAAPQQTQQEAQTAQTVDNENGCIDFGAQQMHCDPMAMSMATQTTPTISLPLIHTRQDVFPTALPMPAPLTTLNTIDTFGITPTNDADIDCVLLQQFSRMGTTDHDDLISQFQTVMNNQMNRDSARFYLEMSNWNLPAAVGCYFEFCGQQATPSMQIKLHEFVNIQRQAFRLENNGVQRWPENCFLASPIQTQRIPLPALRPTETCDIIADMIDGLPEVLWRACTPNGCYFGDPIWILAPGVKITKDELNLRAVQLVTTEIRAEIYPQMMIAITMNQ